jgi:hypothetical protein
MGEKRSKIKELKKTRVKPSKYLDNFILSFSKAALFIHSCIEHVNDSEVLMHEAKRNYIISITSRLETFYRDLLIHVLNNDKSHLEKIVSMVTEKKKLIDIHKMLEEKITFNEYVASHFKYQSIEAIDKTFSILFRPKGYLESLESHKHSCYTSYSGSKLVELTLPDNWRKDFAFLFSLRHKLVHDSNAVCDISPSKMATLEALALMIGQFTGFLIDKKYGKTVALEKNGLPVFITIEDLINKNWRVIKKAETSKDTDGFTVVKKV